MRTAAFIIVIFFSQVSWAKSSGVQVARYTNISPVPSAVERDPLSSVVQMVFPKKIQHLNQAFDYLMQRTGYKMAPLENSDPLLPILLVSSIPEVHREIGPITIEEAMRTLAGEPWEFIVDPVNRLVSFELRPKYRGDFEAHAVASNTGNDQVQLVDGKVKTISPMSDDEIEIGFTADNTKSSASTLVPATANSNISVAADKNLSRHLDSIDMDAYREEQKVMLGESVALNLRSVEMEEVLSTLMPSDWNVDIQVEDPAIRFAKFDVTSQNSRRTVLQDFLAPLGLKIDFYPAIQPKPLAVVSGK